MSKHAIIARGPTRSMIKSLEPPHRQPLIHKPRDGWFADRAAFPDREPDSASLIKGRDWGNQLAAPAHPHKWQPLGPTNMGGRLTCLVVHPKNSQLLFAGAASGGVWRSRDAGHHWELAWHDQPVMQIGSLAIDPHAPHALFCGTGEAVRSGGSYSGNGVYCSRDEGLSWTHIAASDDQSDQTVPRRIGTIAVDPFDSGHLSLGGITLSDRLWSAMFTSRDGGETWHRENFISKRSYWCHSIVFHPKERGFVFAAMEARGAQSGIWRSTDGGAQWTQLAEGLPSAELFTRTSLAIGAREPYPLYALSGNGAGKVLGVFRSVDSGDHWQSIGGNHFANESQMLYNNCLAVHPENPQTVIAGGIDLHLTHDGGLNWQRVTEWDADESSSMYVHSDHHAVTIAPRTGGHVYDVSDGGMAFSADGYVWETRNNGLNIAMFYGVDVAAANSKHFGGGCQDIGTVVTESGQPDGFQPGPAGDGGWMVYDPRDSARIYGSYQNIHISRHQKDGWFPISPNATDEERHKVFLTYIAMHPSDSNTIYTGSDRVWRTRSAGEVWAAVSPVLDASAISAIAVDAADPRNVYAGTQNGGFFRSRDGGNSWSGNLAGMDLPGKIITCIVTHPLHPCWVFVTIGSADDDHPYSHIFHSPNGGWHWQDLDQGRLPNVPYTALEFQTELPDHFFAASHCGVYMTEDLGKTWKNQTGNLPPTPIMDLAYHDGDRTLTAATFGSGLWRLQVDRAAHRH